ALPEGINAPTVEVGARIACEFGGVATRVADRFPQPGRLIGLDALAADFLHEQMAAVEGHVANHFGVEAKTGASGEQAVVGIAFDKFTRSLRRLPIGMAGDDQAVEMLDIPSAFDEFDGEPIQEFRMARGLALQAKVVSCLDEPISE